jgi:hypothetical protein
VSAGVGPLVIGVVSMEFLGDFGLINSKNHKPLVAVASFNISDKYSLLLYARIFMKCFV